MEGDLNGYLSGRLTLTFQIPPSNGAAAKTDKLEKKNLYQQSNPFSSSHIIFSAISVGSNYEKKLASTNEL